MTLTTDIVLESVRVVVLLVLLGFITIKVRAGQRPPGRGWPLIVGGFALLLFGSLLDLTDNFPALNRFAVIGDTPLEALLEKFVGFLGGFVLLGLGFILWLGDLRGLSDEIARGSAAATALRSSEQRFLDLFALSSVGTAICAPSGAFREVNQAFHDLLGYDTAELPGQSFSDVIDPEGLPEVTTRLRRLWDGEIDRFRHECYYRRKNGRPIWGLAVVFALRDADGTPAGFVAQVVDLDDRHQAEETLRRSEERFRDFAESATDWFWETGPDHRLTWLSDGFDRLTGEDGAKLIGLTRWESALGDPETKFWQAHRADLEARRSFRDLRYRAQTRRGTTLHRQVSGVPVFDAKGVFCGYRGTTTDVTWRVEAEDALREVNRDLEDRVRARTAELEAANAGLQQEMAVRNEAQSERDESEARLAEALRQVKLAYWRYSFAEKTLTHWSEEAATILGLPAESLPSDVTRYLEWVHPDDRDRIADLYGEKGAAAPDPEGYRVEYRFIRPDRAQIWLRGVAELESDAMGRPIGYRGTIQDITDIKVAEEAVRTRDAWLRAILDNAPIQIALKDTDCRLMAVSGNTAAEFGFDNSAFIGRSTADFLPAEVAGRYLAADREVLATGEPRQQVVVEDHGGRTRHLLNAKFPLRDDQGRIVGVCSLTSDITEMKEMEARLSQAQKMEAVGQLTGGVAHDFNNLLAVIQGNAELLAATGGGESYSQAIMRASRRGAELTHRLLAFSRQQSLQPKTIDLAELVEGLSELLLRTLGETVTIITVMADSLVPARADPGQVENALLNLAINARDAMPDGGELTIACRNATLDAAYVKRNPEAIVGDYLLLEVTDNGSGMTADVLAHAVEPFFTTKPVGAGSGLGLSMVYGFAKQSNGHLEIESTLGRGTTVRLYLPRAGHVVEAEPPAPEASAPRGRGETVLVIEDDSEVRAMTVKMVEGLGYRVVDVPEATAARAVLENGAAVDLILSDVVLPGGVSGPQFAREVALQFPDLAVVFMSGYPAEAAMRDGVLDADTRLLNKPFQKQALAAVLREALAGRAVLEKRG